MRPGLRSTSVKKTAKKLPGNSLATHFRKEKPSRPVCASCRSEIHGLPRLKPVRYSSLPRSRRRVNRKFGGELCSKCSREEIKKTVRVNTLC